MPNLLVVSRFPDADFVSCDYIFVHHLVFALESYFDRIDVIAPSVFVPRALAPLGRLSRRFRELDAKQDFLRGKVRVHFAYYAPWAGRIPTSDRPKAIWEAIEARVSRLDIAPDLVHAHMSVNAAHGLKLARRFEVPSVLTLHDHHDRLMRKLRAESSGFMELLKETSALIRVTPRDIDAVRSALGGSVPLHYLPNGYDAAHMPKEGRQVLRKALGLPAERRIFVSVAHWDERKDPFILLAAMAKLKASGGQALPLLCLIGGDYTRIGVERRIAQLQLGDDVKFLGQRPPDDVLRYMRAGDAVVPLQS